MDSSYDAAQLINDDSVQATPTGLKQALAQEGLVPQVPSIEPYIPLVQRPGYTGADPLQGFDVAVSFGPAGQDDKNVSCHRVTHKTGTDGESVVQVAVALNPNNIDYFLSLSRPPGEVYIHFNEVATYKVVASKRDLEMVIEPGRAIIQILLNYRCASWKRVMKNASDAT